MRRNQTRTQEYNVISLLPVAGSRHDSAEHVRDRASLQD